MKTQIRPYRSCTLKLTAEEHEALVWLLVEERQRMDDDGRDGAFDASAFRSIYNKLKAAGGRS